MAQQNLPLLSSSRGLQGFHPLLLKSVFPDPQRPQRPQQNQLSFCLCQDPHDRFGPGRPDDDPGPVDEVQDHPFGRRQRRDPGQVLDVADRVWCVADRTVFAVDPDELGPTRRADLVAGL